MKVLTGGFFALLLLLLFAGNKQAFAAEQAENIWNGSVTVTETGEPTVQDMMSRPDCEFKNTKVVKPNLPYTVVFGSPIFLSAEYLELGSSCVITNSQGSFSAQHFSGNDPLRRIGYYSGSKNVSKMYSLNNSNASVFLDPASSGDNVLMISGVSGTNYNLTLLRNFSDESRLSNGGVNRVEWRIDTVEERLKNLNGSNFPFRSHAFSANGRYLAIRYGNVLGKIDLQTLELTPIEYRSGWPVSTEIAISNNGRHVFASGNGMYFYDTSTCEVRFNYGSWESVSRTSYPGCVKSRDYLPELTSAVPEGYGYLYRPYFGLNSASLNIGGGKRVISAPTILPNHFEWKEFNISADLYQSQVDGYIALGDSFSSGEGDLEGGTWYEPGTDEQGNKDTFEGRNLCHLSRRSYPYLIAKELGYLSGSPDQPVTPSEDGLFHSVACSGAVIHNILGGKGGIASGNIENAEVNNDYDNQYRNDYLGSLGVWQPGTIKQMDFFNGESPADYRDLQNPSVITIGIGGNDAGFGDTITACIMPGTCKQAVSGSPDASMLAAKIADLKPELIKTYKAAKDSTSESRVYVHGYPKFAQTGGDCALNVRLDEPEIVMANEGVSYMNEVVRAAALEAGVFYVNVEDILLNRNLCSLAPQDQKAFNGVTAGNDISNLYLNIGSRGLCYVRNGCFGKETFHPNQLGHQLYKEAVINQTNNLIYPMPVATPQPYPMPSDFFGDEVRSVVTSANVSGGFVSDITTIPAPKPLTNHGTSADLNVNQSGLLPGSVVELIVHSEPIVIGSYQVSVNGEIDIDFDLPAGLEPGIHEIHLEGIDKFNERFDYYESIIIGESSTDFDGDGLENSLDKCPIVKNSNVDVDRDGIDDVCDEEAIPYVEPPPPPPVDPPVQPKPTLLQKLLGLIKKIVKVLIIFFK